MKFLIKIEYILNKIIIVILEGISSKISDATPNKVKTFITKSKTNAYQKRDLIQKKIKDSANQSKVWAKEKVTQTKTRAEDIKKKTNTTINKAKTYDWKSLNASKISAIIAAILVPYATKLKSSIVSLKPSTIIGFTVTGMAVGLSSITIYNESKNIEEKINEGKVREPSSISDTMDKNAWTRSRYRNYKQKRLSLSSVSMPIYIKNRQGMQSIKIDFTFISSNRYIAQYFKKPQNEFRLRDRINKTVEPVIPSFPMEPEGKRIIKDKIKAEMNILLKEMKIEGEISEIYIDNILNG